jgi:hypothetical protein
MPRHNQPRARAAGRRSSGAVRRSVVRSELSRPQRAAAVKTMMMAAVTSLMS